MVGLTGPVPGGGALSTVTTGEQTRPSQPHSMETSPILQALRTVTSPGTASSEVTTAIDYDQMSYILTIMVTISVISILILIVSVSTIFVILW